MKIIGCLIAAVAVYYAGTTQSIGALIACCLVMVLAVMAYFNGKQGNE